MEEQKFKKLIFFFCLVLTILISFLNYCIGYQWGLQIFYLIPICIVAWYNGFSFAVVMVVLSVIDWLYVNLKIHPYSNFLMPYWNAFTRLATFTMISFIIARLRNMLFLEKSLNEELVKKNEQLRQLDSLKDDFVNHVSHELRTPLTVIKEIISLLYDQKVGPVGDKQKDLLKTAKSSVDRLARMIDNALDYQKLAAQKAEYSVAQWNINETVKTAGEGFNILLKNKGVGLEFQLQADLPMIKFDNDKIIQVLSNLINNAMKFTSKGRVYLMTQKEGENAIRVSVKDEGIGVKNEDLDKLFQAFSQISSNPGPQVGGTGLGLALCKKIVEGHKGKIGVDSEFGRGSTFYFILPIQERRTRD